MAGTETYIALLRGINVGKAKRIAMADLRDLIERLGFSDTKTLLNSGNAVFRGPAQRTSKVADRVFRAISDTYPFTANVVVLTLDELDGIIEANPLPHESLDHSRLLIAFAPAADSLEPAKKLIGGAWGDEDIAISGRAAYLSLPSGVADSEIAKEFGKLTGDMATARNWATVLKIRAAANALRELK